MISITGWWFHLISKPEITHVLIDCPSVIINRFHCPDLVGIGSHLPHCEIQKLQMQAFLTTSFYPQGIKDFAGPTRLLIWWLIFSGWSIIVFKYLNLFPWASIKHCHRIHRCSTFPVADFLVLITSWCSPASVPTSSSSRGSVFDDVAISTISSSV